MNSKTGTIIRPAAGTTDTVVTGLGFRPTAVFFFNADTLADATWVPPGRSYFGISLPATPNPLPTALDRTLAWGQGIASDDASATPDLSMSNSNGIGMNDEFFTNLYGTGGAINTGVTHDADGFTMRWLDAPYDARQGRVGWLAIDAPATWFMPELFGQNPPALNTQVVGQRYTITFPKVSWTPTGFVLFMGNGTWAGAVAIDTFVGFCDTNKNQGGIALASEFGADPTNNFRKMYAGDAVQVLHGATGAVLYAAKIVDWGRDFVTFECTSVNGVALGATDFDFRMGIFGGDVITEFATFAKPTAAAPAAHTVATIDTPKAGIMFHTAQTALNTLGSGIRQSIGAWGRDAGGSVGQNAIAVTVQDNALTSNSSSITDGAAVSIVADNDTDTTQARGVVTSVAKKQLNITWNPNNAVATQVGIFVFRETTPLSGSVIAGQSGFFPSKFGTPVAISATMRALSDLYPQTFGNVGNIAQAVMAAQSGMVSSLGMFHFLSAAMFGTSEMNPLGITFNRPLAMTVPTASAFVPAKFGIPAPFGATTIAALSAMAVSGIKFNRLLAMTVPAASAFESRFKIILPTVAKAGPDDLPGTVNWHPNPSAERELIGWFTEGGGTAIAQSTEQAWDRAYSVKKAVSGIGQGIVARSFAGLEITGLLEGVPRRINGQMRLYVAAAQDLEILTRVRYTDGTTDTGESLAFTHPGGGWAPPFFAPAVELNPAKIVNYAETVAKSATGVAFSLYADGAQIEEDQGYGATHFAIGTYGHETGRWDGVPDASMTKREPLPLVIHGIGRGGEVVVEATMHRATWDNQWLEDISDMVIDATVTMDITREVTWTISANFTYEGYSRLEENFDWIAPVLKVTYPDGTVKQNQLGLYFLVPGAMSRGEYERSVKVSAFDPLWLLGHQAFTGMVRAFAGNERMRVVRDIIDGGVLTGGDPDTSGRRYAGPNSNKQWKRTREWAKDMERLPLANDILESSGMYPLWAMNDGEMRWRKRGEERLKDRRPVRAWVANLPENHSVDSRIPRISTLKSEVVGTIQTTPEAHDAFDEILMINDDPHNKRVRVRGRVKGHGKNRRVVQGRGDRKRVRKLYAPYVDDEATAAEVAAALADELSNRVEGVDITVLPDPEPNYCHETVLLAVWDAYGDPVAVGQYEPESITWGFTPTTCLQKMKLHRVDNGDTEIIVTVE